MITINEKQVKVGNFPDGTLMLKFTPDTVIAENPYLRFNWYYENDAELFTLICLAKKYADYPKTLCMPYCPHARMDRVKNDEDTFTLKYFCEVINSLNFESVEILDIHSNVTLALLDHVKNFEPKYEVETVLNELSDKEPLLFFPDEGAMKRYSTLFNLPYAFGMKKRNWETGKIEGLDIINKDLVKDRNILIIDDICSKGGTFFHAAKALKEAGANKIYLYISHAERTMTDGDMYIDPDLVEHIYTTNSLFKPEWDVLNKVTVIEF